MKLEFTEEFRIELLQQFKFISKDKSSAAKKFKSDLINQLKTLPNYPFKHRKSIYFEDEMIRDFIFKGYTILYKIDPKNQIIFVFSLIG